MVGRVVQVVHLVNGAVVPAFGETTRSLGSLELFLVRIHARGPRHYMPYLPESKGGGIA